MQVIKKIMIAILIAYVPACHVGKKIENPSPAVTADTTLGNTFTNPLLPSGPDPWIIQKDGYYYYTHTAGNKIVLWKTKRIDELGNAASATVWAPTPGSDYSSDIWAPELHFTDNKWYIYFAADNGANNTHRIYVLENASADPLDSTSWTFKGKLIEPENKWAIDASVFTYKSANYIVWSGWQGDKDGEQDLYIAKLRNPWTIEGSRVMISKPDHDWETRITQGINVTVNEGPEALQNESGRLYLTFSAGGCWSDDYCLGLLTLKDGGDPLNPGDWSKKDRPVFSKNISGGAYGPGHNGFFKSPDGKEDWIIYHANNSSGQGCGDRRNPRIQKFGWAADGAPDFGYPVPIGTRIKKPAGEQQ